MSVTRRSFRLGGAWIETPGADGPIVVRGVAPSGWEGRGLKQALPNVRLQLHAVAPSGWEGRGLKPEGITGDLGKSTVAPSGWEGRGLKHLAHAATSCYRCWSLLPVGRGVD